MPQFIGVTKKWGNKSVFDNFSLTLPDNKISVILGESGVGKTTLLNIAAGLVSFEGKTVGFERCSYAFQEHRLIGGLTARENVLYALSALDEPREKKNERATAALEKMRALPLADKRVDGLSGGEKQRVSLSRALAYPSDVLLLDEPFNSLDISLKEELMTVLKKAVALDKKTVLLVTHSVDEAMYFGEFCVVLKNGAVVLGEKEASESFGYEKDGSLRKKIIDLLKS